MLMNPTLLSAVRKELNLHLASPISTRPTTSTLIQVAEVSGVDGFAHLLSCLFETLDWVRRLPSERVLPDSALKPIVLYVLRVPELHGAVLAAVRNKTVLQRKDFLIRLVRVTELNVTDRFSLALIFCSSNSAFWKPQGLKLLEHCITQAKASQTPIPHSQLQAATSHINSVQANSDIQSLLKLPNPPAPLPVSASDDKLPSHDVPSHSVDVADTGSDMAAQESIADVLQNEGAQCSQRPGSVATLLTPFTQASDHDLARVLSLLVGPSLGQSGSLFSTASDPSPSSKWNVEAVATSLKEKFPDTNWTTVLAALDHEEFLILEESGLHALVAFWREVGQGPFPIGVFINQCWNNVQGQLSFLRFAVLQSPETLTFKDHRSTVPALDVRHRQGDIPSSVLNHSWYCRDLLEVLVRAADMSEDILKIVLIMLENPTRRCPEALIAGFGSLPLGEDGQPSRFQKQVVVSLFPPLIDTPHVGQQVMQRLWDCNPTLLTLALQVTYETDPQSVNRILNAVQELKILTKVLDTAAYAFALDIAALASRREFLNLELWLTAKITSDPDHMVPALANFLSTRMQPDTNSRFVSLAPETFNTFLQTTMLMAPNFTNTHKLHLAPVLEMAQALNPAMKIQPVAVQWQKEVEMKADEIFKSLYKEGEQNVHLVIKRLQQLQVSEVQEDKDIASYLIYAFFEEYRFFHKYPTTELVITATFLGMLINTGILQGKFMIMGMKMVLDAVNYMTTSTMNEVDTPTVKMFNFSVVCLRQMGDAIAQYPQYCVQLIRSEPLKSACPAVYQLAQRIVGGVPLDDASPRDTDTPTGQSAVSRAPPHQALTISATSPTQAPSTSTNKNNPSPFTSPTAASNTAAWTPELNPPPQSAAEPPKPQNINPTVRDGFNQGGNATLMAAAGPFTNFPEPPEKVQDRVAFIVNQATDASVQQVADEISGLLEEPFYTWFANYMVVKRAAQETNYQGLYAQLLESMGNKQLMRVVLEITYHYVHVMLKSEKIKSEQSERALLKQMGSWLGKITLARDRPILFKHLDTRSMIMVAYKNGCLIAVFPFLLRVLSEGAKSSVFSKATNPFVQCILGMMLEIYNMEHLKVTLRFDVEQLLKLLNVTQDDIPRTTTFQSVPRAHGENNPDFKEYPQPTLRDDRARGANDIPTPPPDAPPPGVEATMQLLSMNDSTPHQPSATGQLPSGPLPNMSTLPGLAGPSHISGSQSAAQAAGGANPVAAQSLLARLHNYINIPPELGQVEERWKLKQIVPMAVDRAVGEIMMPAVERSVTIACMTTQELVQQDFALEPDENRIRSAAHLMASSLAGSLALVTCREALRVSLTTNMKTLMKPVMQQTGSDIGLLDQAVELLVNQNHHVGCSFIEQAAMDKAIQDVEEHLAQAYALRRTALAQGRTMAELLPRDQSHFPAALPKMLILQPGMITKQQQQVYEDFPRVPRGHVKEGFTESLQNRFRLWLQRLDSFLMANAATAYHQLPDNSPQKNVLPELGLLIKDAGGQHEVVEIMALHMLQHLWDLRPSRNGLTTIVTVLDNLVGLMPAATTRSFITRSFVSWEDEKKWSIAICEALIRLGMLDMNDLDVHIANLVMTIGLSGSQTLYLDFVQSLIRKLMIDEQVVPMHDLTLSIEAIQRSASRSQRGGILLQLLSESRVKSGLVGPGLCLVAAANPSLSILKDSGSGPQRSQISAILEEWCNICEAEGGLPSASVQSTFFTKMQTTKLLDGDAATLQFLRIALDLVMVHSQQLRLMSPQPAALIVLDNLVHLLAALFTKHQHPQIFFNQVLTIAAQLVEEVAKKRKAAFCSRPFFRFFVGVLHEIMDTAEESIKPALLQMFAAVLRQLQPQLIPGFSFSWLELLSHRHFMPPLLLLPNQMGWSQFHSVLIMQLRYLEPYLRSTILNDAIRTLYKGTLRVLLVLLHDFPEFLCQHHFHLCDAIPTGCIQMRNLILSAFPRAMRLPDPFTPQLKVDQLPEMNEAPSVQLPDWDSVLGLSLRGDVEAYLAKALSVDSSNIFLQGLKGRLMLSDESPKIALAGTKFNTCLINALTLYIGVCDMGKHGPSAASKQGSPAQKLLTHIASVLNSEGRYIFFSALANQLRFPSSHTHYFSCILLHIFCEVSQDSITIREQITRVLLERVIVNRPHPWGLLITFIELIKNPRYDFWQYQFLRCAPEIERLFDSVYKSCHGSDGANTDGHGLVPQIQKAQ